MLNLRTVDELRFEKGRLELPGPLFSGRLARSLRQCLLFSLNALGFLPAVQQQQAIGIGFLRRRFDLRTVSGQAPGVINPRATVGTPDELAHTLRAGEPALSLLKQMCGIGMRLTEESRQKSKRIRLIFGRVELQFVREIYYRCHGVNITERENPRNSAQTRSRGIIRTGRLLRLRFSEPMQNGFALALQSVFMEQEYPDVVVRWTWMEWPKHELATRL